MLPLQLPTDEQGTIKAFHVCKLRSVYESKQLNKTFHLHPEFVHFDTNQVESTFLCHTCSKFCKESQTDKNTSGQTKLPPFSIANGVDFGDGARLGLAKPSLMENILISKHRHYHNVVKIQSNTQKGGRTDNTKSKLRAHSILFRHDAPVKATLPIHLTACQDNSSPENYISYLKENLTIHLLGTKEEIDPIAKNARMATAITARSYVIYQWLSVLQQIHPLYYNSKALPPFHDFKNTILQCKEQMYQSAQQITDKETLNAEKSVGDDIAGIRSCLCEQDGPWVQSKESHAGKHERKQSATLAPKVNDSIDVETVSDGNEEDGIEHCKENPARKQETKQSAALAPKMNICIEVETVSDGDEEDGIEYVEIQSHSESMMDHQSNKHDDQTKLSQDDNYTKNAFDSDEANTVSMSYSYVVDENQVLNTMNENDKACKNNEEAADYIESIASVFNVDVNKSLQRFRETGIQAWTSKREAEPISEFDDMTELLTGAFPQVFILGNGYFGQRYGQEARAQQQSSKDSIGTAEVRHLLLQYTTAAATSRELHFYMFDMQLRHSFMRNLSSKIKKDPHAFSDYAELVNSDSFKEKICKAAEDPKSQSAKEVLKTVLPILHFGSKSNPLGPLGDSSSVSHAIAMQNHFAQASTFVTITPDDVSSPTSFRLSFRSNSNETFPAYATEEHIDKLKQGETLLGEGSVPIPMSYTARMKASVENPVAVAQEYQVLIENVLTILLGCPPNMTGYDDSKTVRTWYFKGQEENNPRHKGIFGHVTAFFGMTETQQRGALHFHVIIWGGITPKLLEKAASIEDICKHIQMALDSMYTAEVPLGVHVAQFCKDQMKKSALGRQMIPNKNTRQSQCIPPSPHASQTEWKMFFYKSILEIGFHKHTFTCKKPPSGKEGCRFSKPSDTKDATTPVQLKNYLDDNKKAIVQSTVDNTTSFSTLLDSITENSATSDKPLIVWELKRPILTELPEIPDYMLMNLKNDSNDLTSQVSSGNDIKQFCVDEIRKSLEVGNPTEVISSIQEWLQDLAPLQVMEIYYDLNKQLPERNGYVTETNPLLTNVTGGSCNAILLGNTEQSRNALFYVAPYVCKSKVALGNCLSALSNAQQHIKLYPSQASDAGTTKRTVQHLFTRVLNTLYSHAEVSDTQVALQLLGQSTQLTSEEFTYYGADYSFNMVQHELELSESDETLFGNEESTKNIAKNRCKNSFGPAKFYPVPQAKDDDDDDHDHDNDDNDNTETSQLLVNVPVQFPIHYRLRGKGLANMSRYEYYALVQIKPKSENSVEEANNKSKPGRKPSKRFLFDEKHPLFYSHDQVLRSKQAILIINGHSPKKPGKPPARPESNEHTTLLQFERELDQWKKLADKFAMYFLVSFRPEKNIYGSENFLTEKLMYDWQTFSMWINALEKSDLLIDRLRLGICTNHIQGLSTNSKHRTIMSTYRNRNRTLWSNEEKEEIDSLFPRISGSVPRTNMIAGQLDALNEERIMRRLESDHVQKTFKKRTMLS